MHNFRTYNGALEFYRAVSAQQLPGHLRNQLLRAASSIALNLAEGKGRGTQADQRRFYQIAMGSVRECQAILTLAELQGSGSWKRLDSVAAQLYRLISWRP